MQVTEDLLLHIVSYLPAKDLLHFQCVSSETSRLQTNNTWKSLCKHRWEPWPRYRLTQEKIEEIFETFPEFTWKDHYRTTERSATCTEIKECDLLSLSWYLNFSLSGVRGELHSDFQSVAFSPAYLMVPGHPPLSYEIVNEEPPCCSHNRESQRVAKPFSTKQWLRIADCPPHFIVKNKYNAEWLIANNNVSIVSCKKQ